MKRFNLVVKPPQNKFILAESYMLAATITEEKINKLKKPIILHQITQVVIVSLENALCVKSA